MKDNPPELRDILSYAKGKAASIVEERPLKILRNARDIKSVFSTESNPARKYQTFLKKAKLPTGKPIRDLKK